MERNCAALRIIMTLSANNQSINQSINQSKVIKFVTRAASCTELESQARAIASGRVLRIAIEKVGLEASFESI